MSVGRTHFYSIIIETLIDVKHSTEPLDNSKGISGVDFRLGEISVEWIDFTREKSTDHSSVKQMTTTSDQPASSSKKKPHAALSNGRQIPGSAPISFPSQNPSRRRPHPNSSSPDSLSLQPLLAHVPLSASQPGLNPNPLDHSFASGTSSIGRGIVHLFRHAPPPSLIGQLDDQRGECSKTAAVNEWAGERAEGEDGSLVAILAVPAWMRPADFLEFIGGWATGLEGVRMIKEATTPNRSIVLLKFRDPLQAQDFMVIFTGRSFSSLEPRETCHPIRVHHLVLHKTEGGPPTAIPAFPPSIYASRQRKLPDLLSGIPSEGRYELPSCPVCLERLDSTVTGLVTLPCAHTFDCDCLQKWGDSRCPVCRISHLLLSSASTGTASTSASGHRNVGGPREEATKVAKCSMCDSTDKNWICVVCGVVGCGRYSPGKAHARRHWEQSGHVLAMELDTQRVWDYQGDHYVHRLIQIRTDGKLVELPSASSLVKSSAPRTLGLNRPLRSMTPDSGHPSANSSPQQRPRDSSEVDREPRASRHNRYDSTNEAYVDQDGSDEAGPSSNDIDKMTKIEAITLEYSYLLSSQLEAMRQHYEAQFTEQRNQIDQLMAIQDKKLAEVESARARAEAMRGDAEKAREKAERKAEKATALARELQISLGAERAMAQGLNERVQVLGKKAEEAETMMKEKAKEVEELNETVRDLMFSLEAGMKIKEGGGEDMGEGGQLIVVPGKKKGKAKK